MMLWDHGPGRNTRTVADIIPYRAQEVFVQYFISLSPTNFFISFQFPMVEDLVHSFPSPALAVGCTSRKYPGMAASLSLHSPPAFDAAPSRGSIGRAALREKALPLLLPFDLNADDPIEAILRRGEDPIPSKRLSLWDKDLWFLAEKTATQRGQLRGFRRSPGAEAMCWAGLNN